MVAHTYSEAGLYTAVVTATNPLATRTALTTVTIYEALPATPNSSQTTSDGVVTIDVGAETAVATLHYTPQDTPTAATGTFSLAGVYFQLTAYDAQGDPLSGALAEPLTLTVHYDDSALPSKLPESDLQLYRWDTGTATWIALPVIQRNLLTNELVVQLDHLSQFALMGVAPPDYTVYLPLIVRE